MPVLPHSNEGGVWKPLPSLGLLSFVRSPTPSECQQGPPPGASLGLQDAGPVLFPAPPKVGGRNRGTFYKASGQKLCQ